MNTLNALTALFLLISFGFMFSAGREQGEAGITARSNKLIRWAAASFIISIIFQFANLA